MTTGGRSDTKTCASCGRTIEWRRRWAAAWDEVRYCSDACRRRKLRPVDLELEAAIVSLLRRRARDASICPSEAARVVAAASAPSGSTGDESWRDLMEPARAAARRLAATDAVEITQRGVVVDPSTARGAIRIRRGRAFDPQGVAR